MKVFVVDSRFDEVHSIRFFSFHMYSMRNCHSHPPWFILQCDERTSTWNLRIYHLNCSVPNINSNILYVAVVFCFVYVRVREPIYSPFCSGFD